MEPAAAPRAVRPSGRSLQLGGEASVPLMVFNRKDAQGLVPRGFLADPVVKKPPGIG